MILKKEIISTQVYYEMEDIKLEKELRKIWKQSKG